MNHAKDIFQYVQQEETAYQASIKINDSWNWSMKEHILLSELYLNSQLKNGKTDYTPVKNIVLSMINLQHRAEDIEMRDIEIYVDNPDLYHLSLLVKRYHDDVFVQENDIDTFIDKLNISRIDLGGGLSKHLDKPAPEVVPLQMLAFCNQRDILSAPFAIKHRFAPDELLEMGKKGWGDEANGATSTVEEVINTWRKQETKDDGIVIYEVHGNLPKSYSNTGTDMEYTQQMFIVSFLKKENYEEGRGIILYATEEDTLEKFKLTKRDEIFGRALGRGGVEELFEAQVWTNYDMIRRQNMLDAASVTILKSTDPTVSAKHTKGLRHMKNLEIVDIAPNSDLSQIDTYPRSIALFEKSMNEWEIHARDIASAQEPLSGKEPTAGTPFSSLQLQVQQGMGIHTYRMMQFARHLEEIYRDWIIPHIKKKITKGSRFLSTLSVEEMQYVADKMAVSEWNKFAKDKILSGGGGKFAEGEKDAFIEGVKKDFRNKGSKHFLEVLKGEFKDSDLSVKVSVAGKSKNLSGSVDKLVNIFRFIFSNPQGFAQVMQMPGMSKAFNDILEFSGMSPVNFSGIENVPQTQEAPTKTPTELPALTQQNA